MKFIVIEGLDGSGKSTQVNLVQKYFKDNGLNYKYLHFPRTDSPVYGDLVARFLRGELGEINQVNPYLVALIYAGDRENASLTIRKWIEKKYYVLVDRYVNSNIAFQCAKLESEADKKELRNWINMLEYQYFKIPKPDLSIFLDVPFSFTRLKLKGDRSGTDRNYLNGAKDIHEENIDFQNHVRNVYLDIIEDDENFYKINCQGEDENMLPPDQIFNKITGLLTKNNIFG